MPEQPDPLDEALSLETQEVRTLALVLAQAVNSQEPVLLQVPDGSGRVRRFEVVAKEVPEPPESGQLELLEAARA